MRGAGGRGRTRDARGRRRAQAVPRAGRQAGAALEPGALRSPSARQRRPRGDPPRRPRPLRRGSAGAGPAAAGRGRRHAAGLGPAWPGKPRRDEAADRPHPRRRPPLHRRRDDREDHCIARADARCHRRRSGGRHDQARRRHARRGHGRPRLFVARADAAGLPLRRHPRGAPRGSGRRPVRRRCGRGARGNGSVAGPGQRDEREADLRRRSSSRGTDRECRTRNPRRHRFRRARLRSRRSRVAVRHQGSAHARRWSAIPMPTWRCTR